MVRRLCIFFLLQLLYATTCALEKGDQVDLEYFSRRCPPERCTGGSTEIRYPFRLESSHPYCGSTGLALSCSGDRTILPLPSLPPALTLSVVSINYSIGVLTAKLDGPSCPLQYINLLNFSASSYSLMHTTDFITVNCSSRINYSSDGSSSMNIAGPISCLGGGPDSIYAVDSFSYMDEMPPYCIMISDSVSLPQKLEDSMQVFDLTSLINAFTQKMEIELDWTMRDETKRQCVVCEFSGGRCGFSQARSQVVCFKTELHGMISIVTSDLC
ncbi:hypothetical protein KSP40_PGU003765 [Platanthera guangdongensis]|uniref:RING-type E3 ubiquitin transferase n=1 Tax=Platanthera guangdongensis TaxID=2320717 RepID=A0ABR2M9U9_9ASPA